MTKRKVKRKDAPYWTVRVQAPSGRWYPAEIVLVGGRPVVVSLAGETGRSVPVEIDCGPSTRESADFLLSALRLAGYRRVTIVETDPADTPPRRQKGA